LKFLYKEPRVESDYLRNEQEKIDNEIIKILQLLIYSKETFLRLCVHVQFKDARSVSCCPYNGSHILKYVKNSKWINIANRIAKCHVNNLFYKQVKIQNKQNKQQT